MPSGPAESRSAASDRLGSGSFGVDRRSSLPGGSDKIWADCGPHTGTIQIRVDGRGRGNVGNVIQASTLREMVSFRIVLWHLMFPDIVVRYASDDAFPHHDSGGGNRGDLRRRHELDANRRLVRSFRDLDILQRTRV